MLNLESKYIEIIQNMFSEQLKTENYDLYVFGSRSKNNNGKYSDIDISFQGQNILSLKEILTLKHEFEYSEIPYKIDIIDLNSCNSEFLEMIQDDLILIS